MRRFFQTIMKPFKEAWVWYLILLVTLSILVWFVGPVIYLTSVAARLFIILLLVIAWAINALRLQRKRLLAEKGQSMTNLPVIVDQNLLEKALADLQGKYKKALQTVAKRNPWTLFLTFRRKQLPWYLVLGSQGSGKTSMLTESGLHFPLGNDALIDMKEKAEVLVQWRFSKDAVFIDTDGILTTFTDTESLPAKVWRELIELMSWHRIRKSINGIIVTISLQEVLAQSPQQRQQLAHALRTRISEVEDELGVKYPVYVQITKTDVLAGFKEFFEHFTEAQRDQIFGMTFPDRSAQDVVQLFPQEFDALIKRLNDYLLLNLQNINEPQKAGLITMFASQLASCRAPLQSLLNQVFETNHYQEKGYLRGVFFISSRQDTKPINRLLLVDGATLGLQQGDMDIELGHNKAYFINKIFRDVILQETHLMQMSTDQARKMNLHRKSAYVIIAIALLGMGYIWTHSLLLNKDRFEQLDATAQDYLANYVTYYSGHSEIPPSLSELYIVRHTFDPDTDPTAMHWGLYQGNRFSDLINGIYLTQLNRQFVPLLQQTVEEQLRDNINNPSQSYNFLRVYLMLADPTKIDKDFITSWMATYWQQSLPAQKVLQASLNENLADYLNLDKTGINPDKNLIESVRVVLRNTSPAERVFYGLQKEAGAREVSISNEFDSNFSEVFGMNGVDKKILYLYTKQGYDDVYKKDIANLVDNIADSNWVIGREDKESLTSDELASIQQYVSAMYMENYTQAWMALLNQFQIQRFDSLQSASNILDLLAQPTSPIKELLDQVYKNTTLEKGDANPTAMAARKGTTVSNLTPKTPGAAKSLLNVSTLGNAAMKVLMSSSNSAGETTQVGADFFDLNTIVRSSNAVPAPGAAGKAGGESDAGATPYAAIQTAFTNLSGYVQDIVNAPDAGKAAYEAAVARMGGKGDDPISALIQLANRSPEPLKTWLNAIAENTWAVILGQAKGYINQAWQQNVWPAYQQMLQYHYPLYADSQTDTSLSDFTTFFAPGGIYDTFFTQYLQPFVNTSGKSLDMVSVDGSSLPLSNATAQQLALTYAVQQAFFNNSKQVNVAFSIRPLDLSQDVGTATLTIGGSSVEYSHGPLQTTQLIWPGENPAQLASITFNSLTGAQQTLSTTGDWAWLKLLDKGQIKHSFSGGTVQVIFSINGHTVIYTLEVKGKYNPFDVVLIHNLRLPPTL